MDNFLSMGRLDTVEAWAHDVAQSQATHESTLKPQKHEEDGISEECLSILDSISLSNIYQSYTYDDEERADGWDYSTCTSSQSSRVTRYKSPITSARDLDKLQKPVRFTIQNLPDLAHTLSSVSEGSLGLYERVKNITLRSEGILPLQLRDILSSELHLDEGDDSKFATRIRPAISSVTRSDQRNSKQRLNAERRRQLIVWDPDRAGSQEDPAAADERFLKLEILLELETLQEIEARTNDFYYTVRSEDAWNEAIHGRMLKLALGGHPDVTVQNITRAEIENPFQPLLRPELELGQHAVTTSINYALLLEPDYQDPLYYSIRDFVSEQRYDEFNQTSYAPLRFAPSGVFIETKVRIKSYPEAQARLGIWLAAWFNRVNEFCCTTTDLVVPVLVVTAGDWELWFAVDRGEYFDVCGPMPIGGTGELRELYKLRACLGCLGDWMTTDFRRWVENCVRRDESSEYGYD
ncbi:hypothetical protein F4777DRAFT_582314 [Nemania sp. FL0916]|nr:hypothetical protein F4777DRAFT_582314 [Nemania sp. FL0916]